MRSALSYWLELTGTALVLLWIFRNPGAFNSMVGAAASTTSSSVRLLQGR